MSDIIPKQNIQNCIFTIRGVQVMIDSDLAEIYGIETKVLNQTVKRNLERFPSEFRFQLTQNEMDNLRSQFVTSSENHGGKRYLPYAFTEQGVSMLSAVLRSKTAIEISIKIMSAFIEMRKFIATNATLFHRIDRVEQKQLESDIKFEQIFRALEAKNTTPQQGIFYDGQIFDAYMFVCDLVKSAEHSIILIDNYVDESVLNILTKRKEKVTASIYTHKPSNVLMQDLKKYNAQHPNINLYTFDKAHDRFLIIDDETVYHFGASLKDLGKKWFAFSKMKLEAKEIITKLTNKTK